MTGAAMQAGGLVLDLLKILVVGGMLGLVAFGALLVPDVGEAKLLKIALGVDAQEATNLRLFVSNTTPAEGDTHLTYTEAGGGNYAAKALAMVNWVVATVGGVTTAAYAAQLWTFNAALNGNATIYGYYVQGNTSNVLLWAERAAQPFQPANNGDNYGVTPQITLD